MMTVKTRLAQLECIVQDANRLAVVVVGRHESVEAAMARAGIPPTFKGLLVIVNRFSGLTP